MAEQKLTSIAYAFIKYYYSILNSDTKSLNKLYTIDGSLTHSNQTEPFKPAQKVQGNEKIKDYYADSVLEGASVMISTIDVQKSFNESILIVCFGEMSLKENGELSPAHKFVQTFVLVPTKQDIYDLSNDLLRFIPDVDDEVPATEAENTEEVDEAKAETATEGSTNGEVEVAEEKPDGVFSPKIDTKASTPETVDEESKTSTESVASTETQKPEKPEETEETEKTEKTESDATDATSKKSEAVNPNPKPLSWADKLKSDDKSSNASSTRVIVHQKDKDSKKPKKSTTNHNNTNDKETETTESQSNGTGNKSAKKKAASAKKNNSDFYPIYIKGIEKDVTEKDLTQALQKAFGKVETCKIDRLIALVDFADASSQKNAIQAKTIEVKGHVIKLEPRTKRDNKPKKKSANSSQKKLNAIPDSDGFKKVGK
ncbi:BA75_04920T0 [Komagataella pastoris]|uniref:BA75_04920T0 n=1 Tax=Komagataella pastoris TaxID=4922 RepID=A0A1B2JHM8_PICPA|nr:BA75_04920T0 [Komagataella pastoris]